MHCVRRSWVGGEDKEGEEVERVPHRGSHGVNLHSYTVEHRSICILYDWRRDVNPRDNHTCQGYRRWLLTVVPLFPLILLCPLSRSGFIFFFSFFLLFLLLLSVYLHELVFAFNFLHGVLFMIAKLPCSSGRQEESGVRRGKQEAVALGGSVGGGERKESRWWHFRSLSVAFGWLMCLHSQRALRSSLIWKG